MRFKGTLTLLGIALLVGTGYLFYLVPSVQEKKLQEEVASRFFRVDTERLEFMRIKNAQGVFDVVQEKGMWKIRSPRMLPADGKTIGKILDLLRSGKISKIITRDMERASEFGLDKPGAVLAIGFGGTIDEIAFGGVSPSKTGIYAYAKGLSAIFLVGNEEAEIMKIGLYELRAKALFSFDPEAVRRILIVGKRAKVELVKGEQGWMMIRPFPGRANAEGVRDFLFGILNQKADEFYDNRVPDEKIYSDTIRIKLSLQGETNPLGIEVHYWGTGVHEGTVAYQEGMNYSGRLTRDFWSLVNRDASSFRYRNLFDFKEQDVWRIRVKKDAAAYELARHGDKWFMGEVPADGKRVLQFLWFLKAWEAKSLLEPSHRRPTEDTLLEIVLSDRTGRAIGTLRVFDKREGGVLGYSQEGAAEPLSAFTDNLKEPCTVSSMDIKNIPGKKEFAP